MSKARDTNYLNVVLDNLMPLSLLCTLCFFLFCNHQPFMLIEPGYYHEGEFGMRLENIVQVVPAEVKVCMGSLQFIPVVSLLPLT